jgi:hypothetical protein
MAGHVNAAPRPRIRELENAGTLDVTLDGKRARAQVTAHWFRPLAYTMMAWMRSRHMSGTASEAQPFPCFTLPKEVQKGRDQYEDRTHDLTLD